MAFGALKFLPEWLDPLRSIAVAVLRDNGSVVEANLGFSGILPPDFKDDVAEYITEPTFSQWPSYEIAEEDGAIYRGIIRLGALQGAQRTFTGTIYRRNQMFFVVAELDFTTFERLSNEIVRLTGELDEVKRQLLRRNQALHKTQNEIELLKNHDPLTGLPLRELLDLRLEQEMQRWDRYRRPLALLILDVEGLGEVNDAYGREVGDETLHHFATMLSASIRTVDIAVRYGGNEFAALLPETNEMGALIVVERLRLELESQIILPLATSLAASFGLAMYQPNESPKDFYKRAERAVKHSKLNGRSCVTMAGVVGECDHLYYGTARQKSRSVDDLDGPELGLN